MSPAESIAAAGKLWLDEDDTRTYLSKTTEYGGIGDLERRVLRAVDPRTFGDDSLRVLRAVQLAARFELTLEDGTKELCRGIPLDDLPAERIWGELEKLLLAAARPSLGFALARSLGLRGKLCIHPAQVEVINRVFAPTADEVASWVPRTASATPPSGVPSLGHTGWSTGTSSPHTGHLAFSSTGGEMVLRPPGVPGRV